MYRSAIAVVLGLSSACVMAQMTPVGLWKTISDKDGTVQSEVRIVDNGGVLSGKIERRLSTDAKPDDKCTACTDDRKDKLILGLELLRGLKKNPDKDVWEGGTIIDPANGKIYKAYVTPIDGGKKLEMRGFVGAPLFGRTQTWVRAQ